MVVYEVFNKGSGPDVENEKHEVIVYGKTQGRKFTAFEGWIPKRIFFAGEDHILDWLKEHKLLWNGIKP